MTRAVVVPFVAPGLSALAARMVAEIGEEDQERAEHAFFVAMRSEPSRLPVWRYVAGIDWRALLERLRRRPTRRPGPVAMAVGTAAAWLAIVAFGFFDYAVSVCVVFSFFGPVAAVVVAWFAAGVAVCLLAQQAVRVARAGRASHRRGRRRVFPLWAGRKR